MKNVFLLLLLIGVAVVGWINREKIIARFNPEVAEQLEEAEALASATPHPAKNARAAATVAYPALTIPNSAFNKKFLFLYSEAQRNEPELLIQPNWPITLAERTAIALGGAPMPVPDTTVVQPKGLQGSALDQRPKK